MNRVTAAFRPLFSLRVLFAVTVLLSGGAAAQRPGAPGAAAEPPVVDSVAVDFEGIQTVSEEYVRGNIQVRAGMVFNPTLIDQSIRTLYGTDLFKFVEVSFEELPDNRVKVIFRLVPKFQISSIAFEGNEAYSDGRLAKQFELEPGDFLDEFRVNEAAEAVKAYYTKKGFSEATVDYRIEEDPERGAAAVTFEIDEDTRFAIKKIVFSGNESFSDRRLRRVFETRRRTLISLLTGTGRYDSDKLREDVERLAAFYRNEGYLDVAIDPDAVTVTEVRRGRLLIEVPLTENERYFLGEVAVEGNTIFTSDELLRGLELETGEPFSPQRIDAERDRIRDFFTSRGYLETVVQPRRSPNLETRRMDVVFRIRESEKFYLQSINIEGNTKTRSSVIIRELALRPGEVFDLVKMRTSEARLRNTLLFENVRLSPAPTNIPGRSDLDVQVTEGKTGNISFGAGFSSVESILVFGEFRQRNFDLFNWRSGFQGAGQKLRLRVSLGSQSSQALLSFEEPWLFQQRLALGVDLFRTETNFNSSQYNELRTGFEVSLRRRLVELVEGRVSYRLEQVEIFDVNPFGPQVFVDGEGTTLVSKGGFNLLRDTRDSIYFTRNGNRTLLLSELAGGLFGGDAEYLKLEARTAQFFPTFDFLTQSVSLIGRLGSIAPYGDSDEVPFFDRFYLGGPDDLRGFDFRDVGPRDPVIPSETVGGNSYGFFSFEYTFQIAEPFGLAVFYDWGFLNAEEYDFDPSDYNDNWGFGARFLIFGSPLKLDLGFPITSDQFNDDGPQFNFTFGTRF